MSSFPEDLLSQASLNHSAKLSLEVDKPLHFDYFVDSVNSNCKIVKTSDNDKILFKSQDEYTSPLLRLLKIPPANNEKEECLLCETQNSLYFVHKNMLNSN